jgi:superfamily I DNA and RNA helicase
MLHELVQAFDPEDKWHDLGDSAKVAELNKAIRKACF